MDRPGRIPVVEWPAAGMSASLAALFRTCSRPPDGSLSGRGCMAGADGVRLGAEHSKKFEIVDFLI